MRPVHSIRYSHAASYVEINLRGRCTPVHQNLGDKTREGHPGLEGCTAAKHCTSLVTVQLCPALHTISLNSEQSRPPLSCYLSGGHASVCSELYSRINKTLETRPPETAGRPDWCQPRYMLTFFSVNPCQGPASPFQPLSLWSGGHLGIITPPGGAACFPRTFETAHIKASLSWKVCLQSANPFVVAQWPFICADSF